MPEYKVVASTHDEGIASKMNTAAAEGFRFVSVLSSTVEIYFGQYRSDRVLMVRDDA